MIHEFKSKAAITFDNLVEEGDLLETEYYAQLSRLEMKINNGCQIKEEDVGELINLIGKMYVSTVDLTQTVDELLGRELSSSDPLGDALIASRKEKIQHIFD